MSPALKGLLRATAAALVGLFVGFLLIVRFKNRPLLRAIRMFNKRVLNPAMLRLAGNRFWYASRLQHTGRRTGQQYVTPVVAEPAGGGFVIPLPYGTDVDWLKNVLASGRCVIRSRGEEYACGEPAILRRDQLSGLVPASRLRGWRLMGIEQALVLKQASKQTASELPTG